MISRDPVNPEVMLEKMRKYCVYQERSHQEVRYKLVNIGARGDALEKIMGQLIEEGFLDEERFARAYARGKFRTKQWGKRKILQELERRNIGTYLQNKAMEEIDDDEYREVLLTILRKKQESISRFSQPEQKLRLFKFAFQRGFEADLIYESIAICFD